MFRRWSSQTNSGGGSTPRGVRLAYVRVVQQTAVLGNDPIEQMSVRKDTQEVVELAAGHHHELSTCRAQAL
jgi:hypothetical protein